MRIVCFDIESNYFWNGMEGYLRGPEDARAVFSGKDFRFDAATVLIYETQACVDFTEPAELLDFILEADEIVTFNGRTCDLIVLERCLGKERCKPLWQKPHHDLKGWSDQSLRSSVAHSLPNRLAEFEQIATDRAVELGETKHSSFIRGKLARAYRDARLTLELFRLYKTSGDADFTFHDLGM